MAKLGLPPQDAVVSHRNPLTELSLLARLGLMPSDTAVSQRKFEGVDALKEPSRLVRLGLLPADAAVSQRKFSYELNQSMRLGLMLSDTPYGTGMPHDVAAISGNGECADT